MARHRYKSASDAPEALKLRQREHRLRLRVQPQEPVTASADPWLIADEALDCLERVGRLLRLAPGSEAHRELEQVAELLRRLAWGPEK